MLLPGLQPDVPADDAAEIVSSVLPIKNGAASGLPTTALAAFSSWNGVLCLFAPSETEV